MEAYSLKTPEYLRPEKLVGKLQIKGRIRTETGMRVGGPKETLQIGGLDLNVIKTPDDVPYIPGSSLKGKIRSLLAMEDSRFREHRGVADGVNNAQKPTIGAAGPRCRLLFGT